MKPRQGKAEWRITQDLAQAMGYPMDFESESEIMDEIATLTPTFTGVSFRFLDEVGSVQWPCNEKAPLRVLSALLLFQADFGLKGHGGITCGMKSGACAMA